MKPISYLASVGVFTLLLASGCIDFEDDTTREMEYEPVYTGMNDIVNSSNELAMDMYKMLAEESENVFFSPYSIMIALGMVYEGARGRTAEEIINLADATKADLVAMSTHGRSGLSQWAFGSVTAKVLRGGHTPVLMVRARKADENA